MKCVLMTVLRVAEDVPLGLSSDDEQRESVAGLDLPAALGSAMRVTRHPSFEGRQRTRRTSGSQQDLQRTGVARPMKRTITRAPLNKYHQLPNSAKLNALAILGERPTTAEVNEVARHVGVAPGSVRYWMKQKHSLLEREPTQKRPRQGENGRPLSLSRRELLAHAAQIQEGLHRADEAQPAILQGGDAWIDRFLRRHALTRVKCHGQAISIDQGARDTELLQFVNDRTAFGAPLENIFNMDETELFYQATPKYTIAPIEHQCLVQGVQDVQSTSRVTVIACASATGERMPLTVIGKSARPTCFKREGVRPQDFGVRYVGRTKSWTAINICYTWITDSFIPWSHDRLFDRKEHVVLIWNSAPAHMLTKEMLEDIDHRSEGRLHCLFLPKNTTAQLQPLDQGVISTLKNRYVRLLSAKKWAWSNWDELREAGSRMSTPGCSFAYTPNMLDVCRLLATAWQDVSREAIIHCWTRADCLPEHLTTSLREAATNGQQQLDEMRREDEEAIHELTSALAKSMQRLSSPSPVTASQADLPRLQESSNTPTHAYVVEVQSLDMMYREHERILAHLTADEEMDTTIEDDTTSTRSNSPCLPDTEALRLRQALSPIRKQLGLSKRDFIRRLAAEYDETDLLQLALCSSCLCVLLHHRPEIHSKSNSFYRLLLLAQ
ncbi:uncharacterized protein MONBRDRAFT_36911 [Monosiga brevicollis MX1]|uniref:DDE-1 domain-containing protein n=1 Tax=Monosiga brevicollis TaxID=81824 RepID=A9UYC6_MONBE|nr:uncharacterized protein MONBRDRAFT_36911 [Monosiga brevicollis MX1]EDQ89581.1 predicted protein [Monosiga brevicollis MX1]|eukprot:XP_001745610.1 hypothetical protein [Monosiga brevicollis MX1]